MKKAVRYSIVSATVLTLACVTVAHADLASDTGLSFWELPKAQSDLEAAQERSDRLDALQSVVRKRMDQKDILVDDLVAGERTFAEVTEEFLFLNQQRPELMETLRLHYPGASDREIIAQNVLQFVTIKLKLSGTSYAEWRSTCEAYLLAEGIAVQPTSTPSGKPAPTPGI